MVHHAGGHMHRKMGPGRGHVPHRGIQLPRRTPCTVQTRLPPSFVVYIRWLVLIFGLFTSS